MPHVGPRPRARDRRARHDDSGRRVGGLVGACRPQGLLNSALEFNAKAGSITLPLVRGRTVSGQAVWYVVTDSSNRADARRRGVNFAPRLGNALGTKAVQRGRVASGEVVFAGTVNFRPKTAVEPGDDGFPPVSVKPAQSGTRATARFSQRATGSS